MRSEPHFSARKIFAAVLLLVLFAPPALAERDIDAMTDVEFDAWFRCPELLANQEERSAAVAAYYRWAKTRHPEWVLKDIVNARVALLLRHRCEETLKTLPPSLLQPQ